MVNSQLKVYYGPQEETTTAARQAPERVSVPMGQIFPLLADAIQSKRTWLHDFDDDEITISADLYEVILAYQHFRRPSA